MVRLTPLLSLLSLFLGSLSSAAEGSFRPIFNGYDLKGWDGDTAYWSVNDGVLGGSTEGLLLSNTFLIWRGGTLRDFHLQLDVRLTKGNSGIQYRSRDLGNWKVSGYQAEIANEPGKAGFLYEERGRKFLAYLGQSVGTSTGGLRTTVEPLAARQEYLSWHYYRPRDWNRYEIVAKGNYLAHYVNGFKTAELSDRGKTRAANEGVLALQLHAGTAMTVEFRHIMLKTY